MSTASLRCFASVPSKVALTQRSLRAGLVAGISMLAMLCLAGAPLAAQSAYLGQPLGGGFKFPNGVAVDGGGNVYVADTESSAVKKIPAGCISSSCVIPLGGGFNQPFGVAVDSSGNVYVADANSNAVKEIPLSCINGANNSSCVISLGGGFKSPAGVAVDGNGNVYVVDNINNALYEMANTCTSALYNATPSGCAVTSLGGGFTFPLGVAVDGSGNVYVADEANNAVKKLANTCTSALYNATPSGCAVTSLGGSFSVVDSVAVDSSGNVYVGGANAEEMSNTCSSSSCVISLGAGLLGFNGVAVDGSGNLYAADTANNAIRKIPLHGVSFPSINVGSSESATLTFTIWSGGAIGTPVVLTQGATGLDFTDAGTGTCTTINGAGNPYNNNATCTVNVTFTPKYPGPRYGAVELTTTSGKVIATAYVYGTGKSSQLVFNAPLTPSTLGGGYNQPYGEAVDGSGNVYVADAGHNAVKETPAACTSSSCVTTLGGGFSYPNGVAVDGSGNVYVADEFNNAVKEMPAGCTSSSCVTTLGGGFSYPTGVAVDGSGNVYVADNGNRAVKVIPAGCASSSCVTTLGGGFNQPYGVAVDSSGNVYVVDAAYTVVEKLASTCTSFSCVTTLGGGFSTPAGVAVDGSGNIYVSDFDNHAVKEMPAACRSSSCVRTLGGGIIPIGVAVDGSGNVYVADYLNNAVKEMARATPPTVTFPTSTYDGNTDSADGTQTVTVQNIGNQPLYFEIPAAGTNPTTVKDFTFTTTSSAACPSVTSSASSPGILAVGATCNLPLTFTPVAPSSGALTESLVITDNVLNTIATQSITLQGTAIPSVAASTVNSTVVVSPNPAVAGSSAPAQVIVTLKDGSGNPISGATASFTSSSTTVSFGVPYVSGNTIYVSMTDTAAETAPISVTLGGGASGTLSGSERFVAPAYVVTVATDPIAANESAAHCVATGITGDNSNCSLREAVDAANALTGVTANIGFATPLFASAQTIQIAQSTPITISQNMNINGPGANLLTVEGGTTPLSSANYQVFFQGSGNVRLSGVTVANGYGSIGGGGLYLSSGTLSVVNSTFSGNRSNYIGGAIFVAKSLTVTNSTFSGNQSVNGGGAIAATAPNEAVTVTSSTFSGNQTTGNTGIGGAINAVTTLSVTNSTFSGNQAQSGGAIYATSTLTVTNSIFSGDSASGGTAGMNATAGGTLSHIIYYGGDTFDLAGTTVTPPNSINADPKLSALGNYGGPTQTLLPLPGSAAICSGVSTGATTDQRGVTISATRYGQTSCYDVGAVQTQYAMTGPLTVPTVVTLGSAVSPAPTVSLTEDGTALTAAAATVTLTDTQSDLSSGTSATNSLTTGVVTFGSVQFNAAESTDTLTATLSLNPATPVSLKVTSNSFQLIQRTPVLAFTPSPGSETYGTPIAAGSLDATASYSSSPVAGTFAYTATSNTTNKSTALTPGSTVLTADSYTLTATFTPGNTILYKSGLTVNTQFTVLQQASVTTLGVSPNSITPLQTTTLTATVAPTITGSTTPTGSVTFYDASTAPATQLGGSVKLVNGQAQLAGVSLVSGPHILYASYSGDTNYILSSSSATASNITVAAEDFTFTASGFTTQSVVPGTAGTFTFQLAPLYDKYPGPVVFTVTGLPPGATYTVTPASIATNAGPQTVTVTINTPQAIVMRTVGRSAPWTLALLLPVFLLRRTRRKLGQAVALSLLLFAGAFALSGCGSNANGYFGQPVKSYTVTVTGTSGAMTHSSNITLQVQ